MKNLNHNFLSRKYLVVSVIQIIRTRPLYEEFREEKDFRCVVSKVGFR
jgi:hypothetical protein